MHTVTSVEEKTDRELRVGIVGCGHVAKHHLRFIGQLKNVRVAGLADFDKESARLLGEMYGVQEIHGSLDELLNNANPDVVHILTPPAYHYEQTSAAIDYGIHVLVEKPITFSARQTEELYRRAESKGVLICPDFIQLFNPLFEGVLAEINSGSLGRVLHVNGSWSLEIDQQAKESKNLHWSYNLPNQ